MCLWGCLMERKDSIISHSPSRAESPEQPSATLLTVGEVTVTTQSLGFLLFNHRQTYDGQSTLSPAENCNLVTPEQNKDNLYCQVSRTSKRQRFHSHSGHPIYSFIIAVIKIKRKCPYLKTLWKPQ